MFSVRKIFVPPGKTLAGFGLPLPNDPHQQRGIIGIIHIVNGCPGLGQVSPVSKFIGCIGRNPWPQFRQVKLRIRIKRTGRNRCLLKHRGVCLQTKFQGFHKHHTGHAVAGYMLAKIVGNGIDILLKRRTEFQTEVFTALHSKYHHGL